MMVKYMGLNISKSKQLEIFSKADLDGKGELNFVSFVVSMV
jgi:RsiW-degrading membrane proteinase PrsW (M82 family)